MDHYFRYEAIRQRLRVGPLSGYLDAFARQLSEYGYAIDTGQQQLRLVSHLSQWMGRRGLQAHDLSEPVLKRFLADRRRQGRLRNTDPRALGWFLEHLRQAGVAGATCHRSRRWHAGGSRARFRALSPPGAGAGRGDDRQLLEGLRARSSRRTSTRRWSIRNGCAPPMSSASSIASRSRNRPAQRSSPSPAFGPSCASCTCEAGRPPTSPPPSRRYPTGK